MSEEAESKIAGFLKSGNIANINLVEALISEENVPEYLFCVGVISEYIRDRAINLAYHRDANYTDGQHYCEVVNAFCEILGKLFCAISFTRVDFLTPKRFAVHLTEFLGLDLETRRYLFEEEFADFIDSRVDFYRRVHNDFGAEIYEIYAEKRNSK